MPAHKKEINIKIRPREFVEHNGKTRFSSSNENHFDARRITIGPFDAQRTQRMIMKAVENTVLSLHSECTGEMRIEVGNGIYIPHAELKVSDKGQYGKVQNAFRSLQILTAQLAQNHPEAKLTINYSLH